MSKRVHRRKHPAAELNITAFMNLMVVLVPFLLMTAVFSHITILDLNLPPPGAQDSKQPKQPPYELRVTIRKNMLVLSDNRLGLIKRIPSKGKEHNFALLKKTLKQFPNRPYGEFVKGGNALPAESSKPVLRKLSKIE